MRSEKVSGFINQRRRPLTPGVGRCRYFGEKEMWYRLNSKQLAYRYVVYQYQDLKLLHGHICVLSKITHSIWRWKGYTSCFLSDNKFPTLQCQYLISKWPGNVRELTWSVDWEHIQTGICIYFDLSEIVTKLYIMLDYQSTFPKHAKHVHRYNWLNKVPRDALSRNPMMWSG